jgi:hypothetical protein
MRGVIEAAGAGGRLYDVALGEYDALLAALDASEPGDAIAIMCVDEQLRIFGMLRDRGARPWVESAASSSSGRDA